MRSIDVLVNNEKVGTISEIEHGAYSFKYDDGVDDSQCVSISMLPSSYADEETMVLHPAFQTMLPEGFNLDKIRKLSKKIDVDDFSLFGLVGRNLPGRVSSSCEFTDDSFDRKIVLDELFGERADETFSKAIGSSSIGNLSVSGAMPKFLGKDKFGTRATDVIVKSGGREYFKAAENEAACLRIAQKCDFEVPDFKLSKDGSVIAIKRFDSTDNGFKLAVEDFCSLLGKSRHAKYSGTEDDFALVVRNYLPIQIRKQARIEMFRRRIFDELCLNGDSHLKNSSIIYSNPNDVRLSPLYDVLCTVAYDPNDKPARSFHGEKKWLSRNEMIELGASIYELPQKTAEREIEKLTSKFASSYPSVLDECSKNVRKVLSKAFQSSLSRLEKPKAELTIEPQERLSISDKRASVLNAVSDSNSKSVKPR